MLALPALLAGCTQPQVPVARVWAGAISQYALQPIFPIREGVQPGDVHVIADYDPDNRASQFRPRSLWVTSLPNASGALEQIAKSRVLAPATAASNVTLPTVTQTAQGASMWPQPTHPAGSNLGTGSGAGSSRFGLAAMPEVEARATFTAGAAAGGPLLGPLKAALGLTDSREVTVRPVGVEVLSLPFDVVEGMRTAGCTANARLSDVVQQAATHVEPGLATASAAARQQVAGRTNARVMVPTQVFYLRGIDFSFGADTALVAELAAVRAEWQRRSEAGTLGEMPAPVQPGAAPPAATLQSQALATALAQRLVGRQIEGLVPAAASFSFVSSEGVVLRQIFQQPLAFAASGASFAIVDGNGEWIPFCGTAPAAQIGQGDPAPMNVGRGSSAAVPR